MTEALRLVLDLDGTAPVGVFRVPEPGCMIRVVLPVGSAMHASETVLESSHPNMRGPPQRISPMKTYSVLEDILFEIKIENPGVFWLRMLKGETAAKPVTFIVDPVIEIGSKTYRPDELSIQMNIGRCIGHVRDWPTNLKAVASLGYNMVHIPPFQELGGDSHYAISDHMEVSRELFPGTDDVPSQRWPIFRSTVQRLATETGLGLMSDVVLAHVSSKTEWLKDHPDAGYTIRNSPHLTPALFVDRVLAKMSADVVNGRIPGVTAVINEAAVAILEKRLEKELRGSDFGKLFMIDIEEALDNLQKFDEKDLPKELEMLRMRAVNFTPPQRMNILRTKGVHANKLDIHYAVTLYKSQGKHSKHLLDDFESALQSINAPSMRRVASVIPDVVKNVAETIRGRFITCNGANPPKVTKETPLVDSYFVCVGTKNGPEYFARNGWMLGVDRRTDFTAPESDVYLRRQINVWNDCVKLRYGKDASDSPFIWDYMTKYVTSVAEVSKAVRLVDALSIPIHVTEYIVREARKVNPSLYVISELVSGTKEEDVTFVNRIGINALVKDGFGLGPKDLTGLLWASGGCSVAAVDNLDRTSALRPTSRIPTVIFDQTHEGGPACWERLLLSSVISMSCSPVASTRGYDEFLDFIPSVANERRQYNKGEDVCGFQAVRKILNEMRVGFAAQSLGEMVAHYYGTVVSILRCNSQTCDGVWCVARFPGESTLSEIECPLPVESLVMEARVSDIWSQHSPGAEMLPGNAEVFINKDIEKLQSCFINGRNLNLANLREGSVVIFKTKIKTSMDAFDEKTLTFEFDRRIEKLGLDELNVILFQCENEEQTTRQYSTYSFSDEHTCFYAGLQGFITQFDRAKTMDSPVFENMRQGLWAIDYISQRFFRIPALVPVESAIHRAVSVLSELPKFMVPKYVVRLIRCLYASAKKHAISVMSEFVHNGDDFVQDLALASIEFCGQPSVIAPNMKKFFTGSAALCNISLSAGLPFFSSGYMRSWGRDTFIALRGIFLVTGRFTDAKNHLIGYASCVRHGLVPNLQDGCNKCRYNARDATWWFLQALQDYAMMSGEDVFQWQVPHLFPTDNEEEYRREYGQCDTRPVRKMCDVVQDIMSKHANGIHFREWGAGEDLDSVMTDNGFNIDIVTDWNSGFVIGGNQNNCGTWMDKMGCSEVAENRGVPASPRDGAAIEITGMLQSTLRFLNSSCDDGVYPFKGVDVAGSGEITWNAWSERIVENFEGWYYVPTNTEDDSAYFVEQKLVGVRGVYKDTVGASNEFGDYQLRPNLLVAMTVAPELFDPCRAVECLDLVERRLVGDIGMKTLDEDDWRYRPYYNNTDALTNADFLTSGGFNYHNGPEWVWPTGFFFRASMRFRRPITGRMLDILASLKRTLHESPAFGLPEFTNKDGEVCVHSCTTQAWSIATVLDMLYDYSHYSCDETYSWDADDRE